MFASLRSLNPKIIFSCFSVFLTFSHLRAFSFAQNSSPEAVSELWVGWFVLIFGVTAIPYGIFALIKEPLFLIPTKWMKILFPTLTLIGLAIALYIAYVQLLQVRAICGPLENCNTVLQSRYAKLLGFIPNSVLGTLSYLALFFLWGWYVWRNDWLARQAPLLILAITLLGSLLSIYLTILQVITLKALCIWCLSSAVNITILFLVSASLYQLNLEESSDRQD